MAMSSSCIPTEMGRSVDGNAVGSEKGSSKEIWVDYGTLSCTVMQEMSAVKCFFGDPLDREWQGRHIS